MHDLKICNNISRFIERTFFGSKMHSTNGAETNVKKKNPKNPRTVYRFIGGDHNLIQGV